MKNDAHPIYRSSVHKLKNGKGLPVPGVTTVIGILNKPFLVNWANRLGLEGINVQRYVDDKANIGKLAHAMIIDNLVGKETDTSDYTKNQISSAENACLSFLKWQEKHNLKTLTAEQPLVSEKYLFGGQYDIFGEIGMLATKRTVLWGYFNKPKHTVKRRPLLFVPYIKEKANREWYGASSKKRAITPAGFARAFFESNR